MLFSHRKEDVMDFVLATTNQGKAKEINALFGEDHIVRTLADVGFTDEIVEDGETFIDNAIIKTKAVHKWLGGRYYVLADDSGLIIDALDGRPGVQTAYWLGTEITYAEKNLKTLEMLVDVPDAKRTARFVCVIAYANLNGEIQTFEGTLEGRIAFEVAGANGFGYDPIFYVPEHGCTLAELSAEEKNCISHRSQALRQMASAIGAKLS